MTPLRRLLAALAAGLVSTTVTAGDALLDWNELAVAEIAASGQLPPDGARTLALMHVAVFDAVNAIERRYTPYALWEREGAGASVDAAVASAAHAVLARTFPQRQASLKKAYDAALARVPEAPGKHPAIELGRRAADACLALRSHDGADATHDYPPHTTAGAYVPTSIPVSAHWANVAPWSMRSPSQFRPASPPELTSDVWARDFAEVKSLGAKDSGTRSAAQTEDARFWSITGPAAWNPVVRSLATSRPMAPVERARLFALANVAAMDAFIAVFDAKYAYGFWRPITAVRRAELDGNAATDAGAGWLPLLETPLHPEYPCAHCISAAAVGAVLEAEFGSGEVAAIEMASAAVPGVTHRWTRIGDYVDEVSEARIFAGVHYRNSADVGKAMGRAIAQQVVAALMRPVD